jgi:hypothetical protein
LPSSRYFNLRSRKKHAFLVAAGDPGCIGKLGYEDFRRVWIGVRKWLEIFIKFDKDKSGKFDVYELRSALRHAGMNLSTTALKVREKLV